MENPICYCGHNCAKCVTYLATVNNDNNLRKQSQEFYRNTFGQEIPLAEIYCCGGRGDKIFSPAKECPFRKCCREQGIDSCHNCPHFPCPTLSEYRKKYVNKSNQIEV